jgi:phosphatidate cytidylyltransferase
LANVSLIVIAVIAVDIGAYFAGRTIGGPKIAPRISPSKTWAGLGGGIVGATVALVLFDAHSLTEAFGQFAPVPHFLLQDVPRMLLLGTMAAVVAQTGDFFESWLKRKAGVKDSSGLIPGHGGIFDRVDGLLAVSFVDGLIRLAISGLHF